MRAALVHRAGQEPGAPPLSWGQRVVLEALREFGDARLVAAAPYIYELNLDLGNREDGDDCEHRSDSSS